MASGKPHAAKDFFAFVFGQSSQSHRNGLTTYLFNLPVPVEFILSNDKELNILLVTYYGGI